MIAVVQRVSQASVTIDAKKTAEIGTGLVILVGIEEADHETDVDWLAAKVANLRIFSDPEGKMNESLIAVSGELLIISQFTLHASTRKGNRPSFIKAARPEHAIPLYEDFIAKIGAFGLPVKTGKFGADMKIQLVNDGPVTLIIDTQNKQ